MYHHGSVKNKHIFKQGLYCFSICCCAADEFSLQLSPAKSVCAGLKLQVQVHNQTPGKEMEGRGLSVTQTGNELCVPACSLVHTKGLFQTLCFSRVFCGLCQELT